MSRPTRSRRWSIGRAPLLTTSSVATPRSWPPTAQTSHSPRSPAGPVCRSRGYGRYSSVPGWSFVLEAVDAPRIDIARRGSAAQHHGAGLVTRRQVLEGPASRVRGPARLGRLVLIVRRPPRPRSGCAADGPEEEDRRQNHGGAEGDQIRDLVAGVVQVEVVGVVQQVRHGAHQVGEGRGSHEVPLGPQEGGEQYDGDGQLAVAEVAEGVLVVRAVYRNPRPTEAGEVVVERPGADGQPQPDL